MRRPTNTQKHQTTTKRNHGIIKEKEVGAPCKDPNDDTGRRQIVWMVSSRQHTSSRVVAQNEEHLDGIRVSERRTPETHYPQHVDIIIALVLLLLLVQKVPFSSAPYLSGIFISIAIPVLFSSFTYFSRDGRLAIDIWRHSIPHLIIHHIVYNDSGVLHLSSAVGI